MNNKFIVTTVFFLLIIITAMGINKQLLTESNSLITNLTIKHIVKYPADYKSDKKYPLILALHGHGSNEKDLITLSSQLQDNILWVSGRGPHTFGTNAYDWYELPPTSEKIASILEKINVFINELKINYPIDTNKVYLMGFSQGSMIALSYAMAFPESIAGVISQSGAIPIEIGLPINKEKLKELPIIITHGIEDRMMPIERARDARDILNKLEVNLNFNEFHMGHTINSESISAVKKWMGIELNKK